MNPRICRRCFEGIEVHAKACPGALEDGHVAGAEVELSMLFGDVRGSSKLARQMPVLDFTRLMKTASIEPRARCCSERTRSSRSSSETRSSACSYRSWPEGITLARRSIPPRRSCMRQATVLALVHGSPSGPASIPARRLGKPVQELYVGAVNVLAYVLCDEGPQFHHPLEVRGNEG